MGNNKNNLFELFQIPDNSGLKNQQRLGILDDLIGYALNRIGISNNPPNFNIEFESDAAKENRSFANYNPITYDINVCGKNRNLADIGRSTVHEIIHHKQNLDGILNEKSGETGSDEENEANAMAGVIMREYGKINPRIFENDMNKSNKKRLFEVFQSVNKVNINEVVIQGASDEDILMNSFAALNNKEIRVLRNNSQTRSDDNSYVELECVDDDNNKIEFNFQIESEEDTQDAVFKISEVKLIKFKFTKADGNVIVEMDEPLLRDFNNQYKDNMFNIVDEYVDFELEVTDELSENLDIEQISTEKQETGDVLQGGLADQNQPIDFDLEQLLMGVDVELEHTNDPLIAIEIAMDHLVEDPNYYTYLEKMEDEMQGDGGKTNDEKMTDVLLGYEPQNIGDNIDERFIFTKDMIHQEPYRTYVLQLNDLYDNTIELKHKYDSEQKLDRIIKTIVKFLPLIRRYDRPNQKEKILKYMIGWNKNLYNIA